MGNGLLYSACLIEPSQKRRVCSSHNTSNADNTDDQCDRRSQRLRLAFVNPALTAYAFSTGLPTSYGTEKPFLEIYPKFCAPATIVKIRPLIARTANGR